MFGIQNCHVQFPDKIATHHRLFQCLFDYAISTTQYVHMHKHMAKGHIFTGHLLFYENLNKTDFTFINIDKTNALSTSPTPVYKVTLVIIL